MCHRWLSKESTDCLLLSGSLLQQASPLPSLQPPRSSPTGVARKRVADATLPDDLSSLSPASGRRRLRTAGDQADLFAGFSMGTPNAQAPGSSDVSARLQQARRANQDFEALLSQQLAIGDAIISA